MQVPPIMINIGVLLPRSTDYPSMAFDLLDGLHASLRQQGIIDYKLITDNIGFGENASVNYAMAEKMILQESVALVICYAGPTNAEPLYPLAESAGIPFIFLDSGMYLPEANPSQHCFHISLQGTHACYLAGALAAQEAKKILMATSFYDGGYRGPFAFQKGIQEKGGYICGHFVSGYKVREFTIAAYIDLLATSNADAVGLCFSTYLAELFMTHLKAAGAQAVALPFYCAPYMAEEQLLRKLVHPGGQFRSFVSWFSAIQNSAQQIFAERLHNDKKRSPNLFHLLGWEAGVVAVKALQDGHDRLPGWLYHSPRGAVTIHAETHHTYAPLYEVSIVADEDGCCMLTPNDVAPVSAQAHLLHLRNRPEGIVSGWKNNYFCI